MSKNYWRTASGRSWLHLFGAFWWCNAAQSNTVANCEKHHWICGNISIKSTLPFVYMLHAKHYAANRLWMKKKTQAVAMFFVAVVVAVCHKWPFNSVDMYVHNWIQTVCRDCSTVSLNDYMARETNKMALISSFSQSLIFKHCTKCSLTLSLHGSLFISTFSPYIFPFAPNVCALPLDSFRSPLFLYSRR